MKITIQDLHISADAGLTWQQIRAQFDQLWKPITLEGDGTQRRLYIPSTPIDLNPFFALYHPPRWPTPQRPGRRAGARRQRKRERKRTQRRQRKA